MLGGRWWRERLIGRHGGRGSESGGRRVEVDLGQTPSLVVPDSAKQSLDTR